MPHRLRRGAHLGPGRPAAGRLCPHRLPLPGRGGAHPGGAGLRAVSRRDRRAGLARPWPGGRHQRRPERRSRTWTALPFPAYEKLAGFPAGYHLPLFSYIEAPGATMVTSRGCPYQCSYCDRSVFKHGFRYNSADYIYEHMAAPAHALRRAPHQHLRRPLHPEPQAHRGALRAAVRPAPGAAVQLRRPGRPRRRRAAAPCSSGPAV